LEAFPLLLRKACRTSKVTDFSSKLRALGRSDYLFENPPRSFAPSAEVVSSAVLV
jgi:hypothetical protein